MARAMTAPELFSMYRLVQRFHFPVGSALHSNLSIPHDRMFPMSVRLVALVCIQGSCQAVLGFKSSGLYWFNVITYNDLLPPEVDVTVAREAATTRECAKQCSNDQECNSFFFNKNVGKCVLQQNVYIKSETGFATSPGSRYFRLRSASCPIEEGYVIDVVSRTCFRAVTSPVLTWSDARVACSANNEMLTVLEPVEKAAFVQRFAKTNLPNTMRFFIGARRPTSNWGQAFPLGKQDYTWLTGRLVNMTATQPFWDVGKPEMKPTNNAVRLDGTVGFDWDDAQEYRTLGYICERPLV